MEALARAAAPVSNFKNWKDWQTGSSSTSDRNDRIIVVLAALAALDAGLAALVALAALRDHLQLRISTSTLAKRNRAWQETVIYCVEYHYRRTVK